jgi:hypothetical protein
MPIPGIILYYAKAVNPEVSFAKVASDFDCILKGSRQIVETDVLHSLVDILLRGPIHLAASPAVTQADIVTNAILRFNQSNILVPSSAAIVCSADVKYPSWQGYFFCMSTNAVRRIT